MGDAETGGVAEEATERDGLGGDAGRGRSGRKGSGRNFPGFEGGVDVGVEGELAGIDEGEEADGGDGFADGGGLEKRVGGDECRIAGAGDAVGAGPRDFSVGDDGNTDAWNTMNDEAPGDGPRFGGSARESGRRKKAGLDAGDTGGECGVGVGVSGAGSERGEGEAGEQETHEKLQVEFSGAAWLQKPYVGGDRRSYLPRNFRPITPVMMRAMQARRAGAALSLKRKMPAMAVPTAPMPVHTA